MYQIVQLNKHDHIIGLVDFNNYQKERSIDFYWNTKLPKKTSRTTTMWVSEVERVYQIIKDKHFDLQFEIRSA